jgi:hypothetical protein
MCRTGYTPTMTKPITALHDWAHQQAEEYRDGADRPLGGYLTLLFTYTGLVATAGVATRLLRRPLPERVAGTDIALLAVATHRLSRTISKDPVTSPLRAPFTRFDGEGSGEEVSEEVRGHGLRHSLGELLACPMCLAQWCATVLAAGLVVAPRTTRLVLVTLSAVAGADFLQYVYAWLQQSTES